MFVLAYIGPGAGFAVIGSFAILFAALLLGLLTLLSLPFRLLMSIFRCRPVGQVRRCVVIGFDGMDPRRAATLMDAGRLPNLARMRDIGAFTPLGSTCPPISPVAWSTFATGVNPGKHNIFDFLGRNPKTYLPELSSARIVSAKGSARAALLRKSRPFWHLLGERGVFSTILRVPVSFPPERFHGLSLSAMCTPDVRGTQGEFTVFQSAPVASTITGGRRIQVMVESDRKGRRRVVRASLPGPCLGGREVGVPVEVTWSLTVAAAAGYGKVGRLVLSLPENGSHGTARPTTLNAELRINGTRAPLRSGEYTPWVRITFRSGLTRVHAICRFLLVEREPDFRLYVTPLNIDPEYPAMPISWPNAYSIYLAKIHGPFATLGLAEDTWALTEGVIDDKAFQRQVSDIHAEREAMFLNALRRTRRGLCVCVFDLTDRIQHTFMRSAECGVRSTEREPQKVGHATLETEYAPVPPIDDAYATCDRLVGKTLSLLGPQDVLFVLSDHGFTRFTRGVNVNAWLREQGYLVIREGAGAEEYLRNVDWSRTRAYSFGLAGIHLNLQGREAQGIVAPGADAQALKDEIAAKLARLADPATGKPVVRRVYDATQVYTGPYVNNAPDLIVGWRSGYRHSWETAVGRTDGLVFTDNPSKWSGDHCVDRDEVPGVLFCNRKLALPARGAHLADLAPTILNLWRIAVPAYMDGEAMRVE
jgi:predicted AlkP superfamily phosphohydrolase/phosphomutase